jgi:hypothetical protein
VVQIPGCSGQFRTESNLVLPCVFRLVFRNCRRQSETFRTLRRASWMKKQVRAKPFHDHYCCYYYYYYYYVLLGTRDPGYRSWYSDWLRAGRSGDRIPVGLKFSPPIQTGPETHSASYTMGTGSLLGVKRPRAWG